MNAGRKNLFQDSEPVRPEERPELAQPVPSPAEGSASRRPFDSGAERPTQGERKLETPFRREVWVLLGLVALFVLLETSFAFRRHDSFKSHLHDTGLISQSFWSTTQGQFFVNSVNPEIGRSEYYFGNHFTPIYFLIAPFYWLIPSPKTLLFVQSLLIGLGAVPVFGLAKIYLDSARASLLFAGLYLLHPAIWFAGLYDFHAEAFSGTFILYAILYLELQAWPQFAVAAGLAMACKEHVSLVFVMLGLLHAWRARSPRRGLLVAGASLLVFAMVIGVIIPSFARSSSHPYLAERYGHIGSSLSEIVFNAIAHPIDTFGHLFTGRHFYYLLCLLAPVLFLPLASPLELAIGLPIFLANGLTHLIYTFDIGFYHSASILPGVFWAAIRGASPLACRMAKALPRVGPRGWAAILSANAIFWHATTQSAFLPELYPPLSPRAHRSDYEVGPHERRIDEVRSLVGPGTSLSAQFNLASHFTDRAGLYQFPNRVGEVDFVLIDLTAPYRHRPRFEKFWMEYLLALKIPRYVEAVRLVLADRRYGLIYSTDGWLLLRKGAPDSADRAAAARLLEERAARWLALEGRGYGTPRHVWDKYEGSPK